MSGFYMSPQVAEDIMNSHLLHYGETKRDGIYNDGWELCLRGEHIHEAWDIYSTFYSGKMFNVTNLYIAEFNEFAQAYADCDDYLWNSRQWRGARNVRR